MSVLFLSACGKDTNPPKTQDPSPSVLSFDLSATFDTQGVNLSWVFPDVDADEWSLQRQLDGAVPQKLAVLDQGISAYQDQSVTDYAIYRYRVLAKQADTVVARSRLANVQFFSWEFPQVEPGSQPLDTYLNNVSDPVIASSIPFRFPVTSNWPLVHFDCAFNSGSVDSYWIDCPKGMLFTGQFGDFMPTAEQKYNLYVRARAADGTLDTSPLPVTFLADFSPPEIFGAFLGYDKATSSSPPFFYFEPDWSDIASTSVTFSFSGDISSTERRVFIGGDQTVPLPVPDHIGYIEVRVLVTDEAGHTVGPLNCVIDLPNSPRGENC